MIEKFKAPDNVYIADSANVMGDVTMKKDSSVWYQAVVRADHDRIEIGKGTNIQDGCVLHTDEGFPLIVGDLVTVGHKAILHGCTIGDNTLIGMGAIVLNGAKIGKNCMIGAGALVTQGMIIPDGSVAMGSPAKVKRKIMLKEILGIRKNSTDYAKCAKEHFC